jgi:hypothetical protein
MFGFLKAKQPPPPPFNAESAAFKLLNALPRCTALVMVAGPRYAPHFHGDVVIAVEALEEHVSMLAAHSGGGSQDHRVARLAFPMWLKNSVPDDQRISPLPATFASWIGPYVNQYVTGGQARVYCPECRSFAQEVRVLKTNESSSRVHKDWTEEWRCQKGHSLYLEDHEVHFTY